MNLKNRTSNTTNTFDKIQRILAEHNSRKVMFDYGNNGQVSAITFSIIIGEKECGFKLPAMVENVERIMYKPRSKYQTTRTLTQAQKEQAYRTAWANIRDWIDAQMAMVDTQQVKVEQVFLPYLVVNKEGQTLFQKMEDNKFLLGSGE